MLLEEDRQTGSAEHSVTLFVLSGVCLSLITWTECPHRQSFTASLNYHLLDTQMKLFLLHQQQQSGAGKKQMISLSGWGLYIYANFLTLVGLTHCSIPLRGHLSVKQQVGEKLKRRLKQNQEGIPKFHLTILVWAKKKKYIEIREIWETKITTGTNWWTSVIEQLFC